jgi:uncharacterized protein (DUF4415 family)
MRKQHDFSPASGAKRAKDVPHLAKLQARAQPNKTRVTMWIDEDVVAAFRERAAAGGLGYQTEMNRALREAATGTPLTAENLSAIVLKAVAKASRAIAAK